MTLWTSSPVGNGVTSRCRSSSFSSPRNVDFPNAELSFSFVSGFHWDHMGCSNVLKLLDAYFMRAACQTKGINQSPGLFPENVHIARSSSRFALLATKSSGVQVGPSTASCDLRFNDLIENFISTLNALASWHSCIRAHHQELHLADE